MIAKLTGIIDSLGEDWVVIDVNGVGYLVQCPGRTLAGLKLGERASLAIESQTREDGTRLYGFSNGAERDWFRLLQTVQGVGGKVALAILTVLDPDRLIQAIAAQDRVAISRADGVGPKLATRILAELKDKAGSIALGSAGRDAAPTAATTTIPGAGAAADAVSALVNLGYGRSDAFAAVGKARQAGIEGAGELIRAALKELSPA